MSRSRATRCSPTGRSIAASRVSSASSLRIDDLGPAKIDTLVRIELADGRQIQRVLRRSEPSMIVPERATRFGVFRDYLAIGFEHILGGADHLLFVFGLFLLCSGFVPLAKTVTAFTVGHSITLSLAALGYAQLPSGPIEVLIAASVLALAVDLARDEDRPTWMRRFPWPMALVFGLLHGLGFAGALREVGLPDGEIPMALFSFNVGIELGQLAFVAVLLVLAPLVRRIPIPLPRRAAVYAMGSLAAFWMIERGAACSAHERESKRVAGPELDRPAAELLAHRALGELGSATTRIVRRPSARSRIRATPLAASFDGESDGESDGNGVGRDAGGAGGVADDLDRRLGGAGGLRDPFVREGAARLGAEQARALFGDQAADGADEAVAARRRPHPLDHLDEGLDHEIVERPAAEGHATGLCHAASGIDAERALLHTHGRGKAAVELDQVDRIGAAAEAFENAGEDELEARGTVELAALGQGHHVLRVHHGQGIDEGLLVETEPARLRQRADDQRPRLIHVPLGTRCLV